MRPLSVMERAVRASILVEKSRQGYSDQSIANLLGISRQAVGLFRKKHPELITKLATCLPKDPGALGVKFSVAATSLGICAETLLKLAQKLGICCHEKKHGRLRITAAEVMRIRAHILEHEKGLYKKMMAAHKRQQKAA